MVEDLKEMSETTPKEKQPEDIALSAVDLVNKTNEASERLEAANKKHEELLEKAAGLKLQETLDGKASAGEGEKEEADADYAKKVMANEVETKNT